VGDPAPSTLLRFSTTIQPPEVYRGPCGQRIIRLRDDRECIRGGKGAHDVTSLSPGEPDTDATAIVTHRRSVRGSLGADAQERAPAVALRYRLRQDCLIDGP
jgi:hypothetical protein